MSVKIDNIIGGSKTVAGAGGQDTITAATQLVAEVQIAARDANTGVVYIGAAGSTSASEGVPIRKGEPPLVLRSLGQYRALDLNKIGLSPVAAGEGVNWIATVHGGD